MGAYMHGRLFTRAYGCVYECQYECVHGRVRARAVADGNFAQMLRDGFPSHWSEISPCH